MAEVGILNLQIKDNSKQAIDNLGALTGALSSLKTAVGEGIKLAGVATSIKRIAETVNTQINGSTIEKIERLTSALSNLQGLGNVRITIKDSGDTERIRQAVEDTLREVGGINAQFDNAKPYIDRAADSAREFASFMRGAAEIVEQTNWTGGFYQFSTMLESMLRMKSMFALGPGQETGLSTEVEKGWSYWKDGAIEVEGTVTDAANSINGNLEGTQLRLTGIVDETYEAANATREYSAAMEEAAGKRGAVFDPSTGEYIGTRATRDRTQADLDRMEHEAQRFRGIQQMFADSSAKIKELVAKESGYKVEQLWPGATGNTQMTDNLLNMDKIDLMTMKLRGMTEALNDDIRAGKLDTQQMAERAMRIQDYQDKLEAAKKAQQGITESTDENASVFDRLKSAMQRMFPTISGMLKRFAQIAKYRLLRTVIMQITKGFREGVENLYHYSKEVGTSFAPAMDAAATALQQMKNSMGAALSPVIQALIPYLQQVVSWFINLINYVNQFFALLRGQATWTRALPASAEAFKSTEKAAKGAGSAMKDLLADWDELNIIQSESGGGGAGGASSAAEDYLSMFEEVGKFDNRVKKLVEGIKKQFGSVLNLAEEIGVAILGWKFASAFTGLLGTLGGLVATGAIIDLVFKFTTMLDNIYFETGEDGWLVADVLQSALGAYLANKVIKKVIGAGAGKAAASITLAVSAVADIIALIGAKDVSALSEEGLKTSVKSALKMGAGFYILEKAAGIATLPALAAAGEAAALWVAVSIGAKAIATIADTGEITVDRIKELITAAGIGGIGVTLFELVSGAGIAAAAAAGGITALGLGLAFAAAVGVVVLCNLLDQDPIQWGEKRLTAEQIENYVNSEMFSINVPTTVKVIAEHIDTTAVKKSDVETALTEALGTLEVIKLGVGDETDYETLRKQILGNADTGDIGLLGKIDEYIQEAKNSGKLTLQFTPSLVGDDAKDASEWFGNYTTGWDKVNEFANEKGKLIGDMLTRGESEAIIDGEKVTLASLMQQLSDITAATTRARISSSAYADFKFNLGDIDQRSFDEIVTMFTEYKNDLTNSYERMVNEQYQHQGELVAALLLMDPNKEEEVTRKAIADYERMGKNIHESVVSEVERAADPAIKELTEFLGKKYASVIPQLNEVWNTRSSDFSLMNTFGFNESGVDAKEISQRIRTSLVGIISDTNSDLGRYIDALNLNPFNFMNEDLQNQIIQYIRDNIDDETIENEVLQRVAGITIPVKAEAELEGVKTDGLEKDLKETVEKSIGMTGAQFGTNAVNAALGISQMVANMTKGKEEEYSGKEVAKPTVTFAGVTPYNGGAIAVTNTASAPLLVTPGNNQTEVDNTAAGVQRGTADLVSAINNLITIAQSINRKDFSVKVYPTSGLGRTVGNSLNAFNVVTGDIGR